MIEGCAERPEPIGPRDLNPTRSLLMCLLLQTAALTRCQDLPHHATVRVLSFAGTPTNRDRLIDNGFKAIGRTMAGTGVELFERRIRLRAGVSASFLNAAMLRHFGALCDRPPPY